MTPYHIARSQLFVRERFSKAVLSHLDTAEIEAYIEHTRFPVPEEEQHAPTDDFPGLLRAADLIGQLADINYLARHLHNLRIGCGIPCRRLNPLLTCASRCCTPNFFTRMNTIFADVVYVVSATKNGQLEFWAAATPRRVAAAQVQRSLPPGWKATLTSWRLSRGRAAELEMRPNTVRKLTEASSSQLFIGA